FFHVYRSRVRLVERNYYGRIFSPRELIEPAHWMNQLGEDLRLPRFTISNTQAFARRLRRNYIWMFLILLLAWLLKISSPKVQPEGATMEFALSPSAWLSNAAFGPVQGWLVMAGVAVFYAWLLYSALHPY